MKSFLIALSLILAVSVFVCINAHCTVRTIDELLTLANELPKTAEEWDTAHEGAADTVTALCTLWDKKFPFIAFTAGYENTNRCDEAIGAMLVHFQNENDTDFTVARAEFCDCLKRLRILEGFHIQGIL